MKYKIYDKVKVKLRDKSLYDERFVKFCYDEINGKEFLITEIYGDGYVLQKIGWIINEEDLYPISTSVRYICGLL